MKRTLAALAALSWLSLPAQPFYQLESALIIKSPTNPSWDYLTYDSAHDVLFIARRDDGILIYDAKAKKITGAIENSKGGNSTVLVPEFDRGYVINQDGTTTIFQLSTLKTLERASFGENADNGFYDPATKQILVTQGDSSQATFLDAKTGKVTGVLKIDSESLEGTAPDDEGSYYMALRDRDKVIKIDAHNHTLVGEWKIGNHVKPNGVAYDAMNKRLFVSTRGDNPALLVYDTTGKILAEPTIGRGNDQVIFDPEAKKIYTSNGFDGTLVIIDQVDANTYKLAEAATTRPYARTMALDPKTKTVYLTTAEGTVDPSKKQRPEVAPFYPNKYFKDTFTLLTYSRK
ncbi:MAG TPA: YncE family protein [Lacunisphaera sp.]|nr:YncE family protein [Lacunisphaera sp.]